MELAISFGKCCWIIVPLWATNPSEWCPTTCRRHFQFSLANIHFKFVHWTAECSILCWVTLFCSQQKVRRVVPCMLSVVHMVQSPVIVHERWHCLWISEFRLSIHRIHCQLETLFARYFLVLEVKHSSSIGTWAWRRPTRKRNWISLQNYSRNNFEFRFADQTQHQ